MSRLRVTAALAALTLAAGLLAGCSSSAAPSQPTPADYNPSQAVPEPAAPAPHTGTYKVAGGERAVFTTDKGTFEIALRPDKAPNTVSSFLELVASGYYDGVRVHRVEPGFVMQVGDPLTKGLSGSQVAEIVARAAAKKPAADDPPLGSGGPGWTMKAEFNDIKHARGVVAMARTTDPDSAGSQFYVAFGPAEFLDGQYTVFGTVVKGMDVVDKLAVGDAILTATVAGGK